MVRKRNALFKIALVSAVFACCLMILIQTLDLRESLDFFGSALRGGTHAIFPEVVDLEGLLAKAAQCRELPAVPSSRSRLRCKRLAKDYDYRDLLDRVSIMWTKSVNDMVHDKVVHVYLRDLAAILAKLPEEYKTRPIGVRLGDDTSNVTFPIISKAKKIGQDKVTVIPFNIDRHFSSHFLKLLQEGDPVSYKRKLPVAFWRGTTTGWDWDPNKRPALPRRHLIEKWAFRRGLVDVGLSFLAQDAKDYYKYHYRQYIKPQKTVQEQLRYRYLIAVEGNDVATGLKWMLASNSTVLMPPPTMDSWLRESCLIPWVHYVPLLPDMSDLQEKVRLCERHLNKCSEIAQRGTEYVQSFTSRDQIVTQASEQLRMYMDSVSFDFEGGAQPEDLSRPLYHCDLVRSSY